MPSLRFLAFLARRLDGLPVAIVAGTRPREGGELQGLGTTLVLAPLSTGAAAELIANALGTPPDAAFAAACRTATGGNPLLLRELARTASENALSGAAEESEKALALGSAGVQPAVGRRLQTLGPTAVQLARAAAIFGPNGRIDDLAALSDTSVQEAAANVAELGREGIFEAGAHAFAHPLVREAVLTGTAPEEQVALHGRSAARLKTRGARPAEIAVHLLHTRPAGAAATIDTLRTAAREAVADGALDTAVAYLERALVEPPRPDRRAPLVLELGEVEADHGVAGAAERLTEALASDQLTPDERAAAPALPARAS